MSGFIFRKKPFNRNQHTGNVTLSRYELDNLLDIASTKGSGSITMLVELEGGDLVKSITKNDLAKVTRGLSKRKPNVEFYLLPY